MNSDMEELVWKNNEDRRNTAPTGRDRKNMTFKANFILRYVFQRSPFSVRRVFEDVPFTHLNFFRLGKMFLRVFCLFCSADILSRKLTSERVLSTRLSR